MEAERDKARQALEHLVRDTKEPTDDAYNLVDELEGNLRILKNEINRRFVYGYVKEQIRTFQEKKKENHRR